MSDDSLAPVLDAALAAMRLDLPTPARHRLLAYAALLHKWNRVYNLTAIRAADQILTHHLLDSLSVLPWLEGVGTLADVGSGGGLPGIPLAIARPDLAVTSIETVGKKASFQQQARIELGLSNFNVRADRVESVDAGAGFDAVISRAFSSLADFARLAGHLVAPAGALLAMKGAVPHEELARLPGGWQHVATHQLTVPGLDAERHLLVIRRA